MEEKKPGSFWDSEDKVFFPTQELTLVMLQSAKPPNTASF